MAVLHLENVPEKLCYKIAQLARRQQQSLSVTAIALLQDAVELLDIKAMFQEILATSDPLAPGTPDSVDLLREDRNR